ncbi:hypothetical protein D4740_07665 [Actinomyces sp. 2119]|uniref:helix-turn-helix domain-containing protein n=1 Tax=Actinomyces sp. 2119 TaxID=2321393 RepID=UPI000E6C1965|nr:helix-turn-helix domain-containing protein [Actinomyces sp. 2119]RJF41932.1 hypothetical protein D4740_07665 [Actinomyces sp. 2119]
MTWTPLRYIFDEAVSAEVRSQAHRTGLSAEDLSVVTGLSLVTVQDGLSGQVPFSVSELSKVAAPLGVSASEIIARAERVVAAQGNQHRTAPTRPVPATEESTEESPRHAAPAPRATARTTGPSDDQAPLGAEALDEFLAHIDRRLSEAVQHRHCSLADQDDA